MAELNPISQAILNDVAFNGFKIKSKLQASEIWDEVEFQELLDNLLVKVSAKGHILFQQKLKQCSKNEHSNQLLY